ncbi:MAG: DNA adenine methylase [Deltaproteobacteria bacterium]|nr:DNA adenine methylase [Deltaproteobacteria bacterium]MCL4873134.1 DNA adenine methylase [bacterium]
MSIIPWIGGKRRLAKQILPLFPAHTCYCEPFAGGAALFFLKEPSKVEVLNDVNLDLVTLYRVVQHHLEEFLRQFKWALTSRKIYDWLQDTPPETLTDIQRAARFYYLQRLSFGGKVRGQSFGTATTSPARLNLLRIEEELSEAHLRLSRVFVERLSWQECIEKYDREHTFIYCDPPYWGTEGYGVEFGIEQYDLLAEKARSVKGKMLISVNDIPEMRKAFKGLKQTALKTDYSLGSKCGKAAARGELLIRNF